MDLFEQLEAINHRPAPFEYYTAEDLWTDEHTSGQMLSFHLDETSDLSSRRGEFIDRSVNWIAGKFDIGGGIRIADLGCGPGLYTTRLAQRGAQVTGIDFSERSIAYARETARREGLDIRYIRQNYLEFETQKRFDLILMIYCDYCALSPNQRKRMLSTFQSILEPNGAVLLDVFSMAAFAEREEIATYRLNQLDGFWSPDRYYGFLSTFKYEDEKVSLDKYTIIEKHRIRTVYNWLQYFSPEELEDEFRDGGLSVAGLYSDVAGAVFDPDSSEFAVIAHKS